MLSKDAILARVQSELHNDPEKLARITRLWDEVQEGLPANNNDRPKVQLPQAPGNVRMSPSYVGLPAYYGYNNYIIQERNTCGQAVIGSFVDFYNKNPFGLPRNVPGYDNKMHFDNMAFIGQIFHQFGPNFPMPNGVTVRETIMAACTAYGLKYNEYYPGAFSNGADSKAELTNWIQKYQKPVAVLVDTGAPLFEKPQAYTLHWCTVYAYDADGVWIATWEKTYKIAWNVFMQAWHCWWLPHPNNYYQIRVWDQ